MNTRCAKEQDLIYLKELWQEAFHEDVCFDLFLQTLYNPEMTFVAEDEGRPVSVVYLYENKSLFFPGLGNFPCPCFYAFATKEEYRGRRIGLQLLGDALSSQDFHHLPFTMIAPADEGLQKLYCEHFGFQPFFTARKLVIKSKDIASVLTSSVQAITPHRYRFLREKLLITLPHLELSINGLEYQKSLSLLCDADLYELQIGSHTAITALEKSSPSGLYCMELLADNDMFPEFIQNILGHFPCEQLTVRVPATVTISVSPNDTYIISSDTIQTLALLRVNPLMTVNISLPEQAYAGLIFD